MDDTAGSNTADNSKVKPRGKPFVAGDPRINRKGRPKNFDAVRELFQSISHEVAQSSGRDVVIQDHRVTIIEAIARSWATSKDARLQMAFMEWAYGKVPQEVKHGGTDGNAVKLEVIYVNRREPSDNPTDAA